MELSNLKSELQKIIDDLVSDSGLATEQVMKLKIRVLEKVISAVPEKQTALINDLRVLRIKMLFATGQEFSPLYVEQALILATHIGFPTYKWHFEIQRIMQEGG